jgi:questin oxidase-like protein
VVSSTLSKYWRYLRLNEILEAQPLIHLAYALHFQSQTMAIEALAMACCLPDTQSEYITDSKYQVETGDFSSTSPTEIFNQISKDKRLKKSSGSENDLALEYWNALKLADMTSQFEEMQRLAVAFSINQPKSRSRNVVNGSAAVRVLLPLIPAQFRIPLIKQWWLLAISAHIADGGKATDAGMRRIVEEDTQQTRWRDVASVAEAKWINDADVLGELVSLKQMAETWEDTGYYFLKAASIIANRK